MLENGIGVNVESRRMFTIIIGFGLADKVINEGSAYECGSSTERVHDLPILVRHNLCLRRIKVIMGATGKLDTLF